MDLSKPAAKRVKGLGGHCSYRWLARNEGMDPCSGPDITHYSSFHGLFHSSFPNYVSRSLLCKTFQDDHVSSNFQRMLSFGSLQESEPRHSAAGMKDSSILEGFFWSFLQTGKGPGPFHPKVNSQSNCVASSSIYSVCCINECEALLGHVEAKGTCRFQLR